MFPKTLRCLALAGVVAAAVLVRCQRLDTPMLTRDEAIS